MPDLAVILPAAGSSTRFGSNKLHALLGDRRVIDRTIDAFRNRDDVAEIIVVGDDTVERSAKVRCVAGGTCRAESVAAALRAVSPDIEWVAIHDAARPLVSAALIDRVFAAAREHGAAGPALPVHLTIKSATAPLPARIVKTIPRAGLFAMQTPQVMRVADLWEAIDACSIPLAEITDDLQFLELAGQPSMLVAGEEQNVKLTTPLDLRIAELLLAPKD